jgi:hypothetical protein
MKRFFALAGLCVIALIMIEACQEPGFVGSGLLEEGRLNINVKEDFELSTQVLVADSFPTFIKNPARPGDRVINNTLMVGQFNDEIVGQAKAVGYLQYQLDPDLVTPDFSNSVLDSIVLILSYDPNLFYGNGEATHQIKVSALGERIDSRDTLFTSTILPIERLIAEESRVINPLDSITIINYITEEEQRLRAQFRIKLDQDFANEIFSDFETLEDRTAFREKYKGLRIESNTEESAVSAFSVSPVANGPNGLNRMTAYFTKDDTLRQTYSFRFTDRNHQHFEHDFTGSLAQSMIQDPSQTEELIMVQSWQGLNIKINFDDLSFLEDKLINHASLEFAVAPLDNNNRVNFPPAEQLLASISNNGQLIVVSDITDLELASTTISSGFGGNLVFKGGTDPGSYTMNITKTLKLIMRGDLEEKSIFVTPANRSRNAARSVLYGPKSQIRPVKLRVVYTEL